ncbi:DUF2802 domain-containing protein [Methylosarcina fibrata]|uniref:DUF2802 domain-containing protein n=1 Tax=Methylosarcina fibrata TaxID=105972 RepID=UPI00037AF1A4|nr:DUF2802 domain-containing protein [Methylosarcina fibrata]
MTQIFLIALAHAVVTIVVALVWLVRAYLKLKGDYRVLFDNVRGNAQDIAGLYASLVASENRLASAEEQLQALSSRASVVQSVDEQSPDPYSSIIHRVRNGATVDDLMRECNLCRDEAVLLIRLHGSDRRS